MKRNLALSVASATGLGTLLTATPAFAQDYSYPDGGGQAAGPALAAIWCCLGIFALLGLALLVLNIWMFIDALQRQEWEFPGTTSKTTWVVLMAVGFFFSFGWIVALVYYLTVFKKMPRGTTAPPTGQAPPPSGAGYAPPPPPTAGGYAPPPPPPPPPPAPPASGPSQEPPSPSPEPEPDRGPEPPQEPPR